MCNRAAVGVILGAFRSPHSRLRRQCGVIYNVTARAVNIDGFQFITLIWHPTLNRASGCNLNNLALTTSRAQSATWGKQNTPHKTTTVERLQIQPLYAPYISPPTQNKLYTFSMHYNVYLFNNGQNITFLQIFWHFYSIYQNKYLVLQCNINLSNPNYS